MCHRNGRWYSTFRTPSCGVHLCYYCTYSMYLIIYVSLSHDFSQWYFLLQFSLYRIVLLYVKMFLISLYFVMLHHFLYDVSLYCVVFCCFSITFQYIWRYLIILCCNISVQESHPSSSFLGFIPCLAQIQLEQVVQFSDPTVLFSFFWLYSLSSIPQGAGEFFFGQEVFRTQNERQKTDRIVWVRCSWTERNIRCERLNIRCERLKLTSLAWEDV